eukprot:6932-Prorocentrum_minimum.AAC.4
MDTPTVTVQESKKSSIAKTVHDCNLLSSMQISPRNVRHAHDISTIRTLRQFSRPRSIVFRELGNKPVGGLY